MRNLSILIYGEPGMGKTVLGASALEVPDLCPMLMLDRECNVGSIESKVHDVAVAELGKNPVKDKINRVIIKKVADIEKVLEFALNHDVYKSYLNDSLTAFSSMNLRESANSGKVIKSLLDINPAQIQHYGHNLLLIQQVVDLFKNVPALVYYTALEDIDKIEGELVMRVRPDFPGKLSREVMAQMNIVGNMSIKQGTNNRELRFQPTNRVVAKDASEDGKLGITMENPTIKKIMEKLRG
jgi:phage nucleotide-binding protein